MQTASLITPLENEDLTFLTGVPCSYFKDLLSSISNFQSIQHIAASSEGEAIGIASGYHLATQKVPIIYLQNSGLGNAINPLTSLADEEVYGIPMILFLSWRGEPGKMDEPQHKKMGKIMIEILQDIGIPYEFANRDINKTVETIKLLKKRTLNEQKPVALIFRSEDIDYPRINTISVNSNLMKREEILRSLLPKIGDSPIITTTGKLSREVYELREEKGQPHKQDFLTVGSMGCASSIGLGIASQTNRLTFVIDGDGSVLMKMGTLATIGNCKPDNLVHIVIDNGSYESTGGQPTSSKIVDWSLLFRSVGYKEIVALHEKRELLALDFKKLSKPCAIIIYSSIGSRLNLGRPKTSPKKNKREFMNFLRSS